MSRRFRRNYFLLFPSDIVLLRKIIIEVEGEGSGDLLSLSLNCFLEVGFQGTDKGVRPWLYKRVRIVGGNGFASSVDVEGEGGKRRKETIFERRLFVSAQKGDIWRFVWCENSSHIT